MVVAVEVVLTAVAAAEVVLAMVGIIDDGADCGGDHHILDLVKVARW